MAASYVDSLVTACTKVRDGAAVTYVLNGTDDSGWGFLCNADHAKATDESPVMLAFSALLERDPSLASVPDLSGGGAVTRLGAGAPWLLVEGHEHGERAEREREEQLVASVAKHGFHMYGVADSKAPHFTYTVGLFETYGHPELIIFGQQEDFRLALFNAIVQNIKDDGERYGPDDRIAGIIPPDFDVTFRAVATLETYRDYLGHAVWYYTQPGRTKPFPTLAVYWQDLQHVYPWETGYKSRYVQPLGL